MPIVEVSCQVVRAPPHTPFVTALRRTEHVESLVVRLTDDAGHSGFGETPQVWRVTGESLAGDRVCCEVIRQCQLLRAPVLSFTAVRCGCRQSWAAACPTTALQ